MLIFSNGTAYFNEPTAQGDIDEHGKPVRAGAPTLAVPCFIEPSSEDRRGSNDDGAYPHGSYTISLDYGSIDTSTFNPKQVRFVHNRKGDSGIKTVQRVEFYDITRTVQVWV